MFDYSTYNIEGILDTYSLEDILELNDRTEADTLLFLIQHKFVHLPEVLPVDYV